MEGLLAYVLGILRGEDEQEIYPSFDAVPVRDKSRTLFAVVSPKSVQIEPVFPAGLDSTAVKAYPATAVFQVSVLIPVSEPLETAQAYYDTVILPRMETAGAVLCDVRPPCADDKLGRVVMQGDFRLRCLFVEEGSEGA